MLADAQTSGGMLLATNDGDGLVGSLQAAGAGAWVVGETHEGQAGAIAVGGRVTR